MPKSSVSASSSKSSKSSKSKTTESSSSSSSKEEVTIKEPQPNNQNQQRKEPQQQSSSSNSNQQRNPQQQQQQQQRNPQQQQQQKEPQQINEEEIDEEDNENQEEENNIKKRTRYFGLLLHYLFQTWTQIKHHKASYILGLCSCIVVVIIVGSMLSVLGNAPIIFLRIAELDTSEIDIQLQSSGDDLYPFLNYTTISSILSADESTTYHSPRWSFTSLDVYKCTPQAPPSSTSTTTTTNITLTPGSEWMYRGFPEPGEATEDCYPHESCFQKYCGSVALKATTDVLASNSARERRMLLGRTWNLPDLGPGEAHVSKNLAEKLGAGVGDTVIVRLVPQDKKPFSTLWSKAAAGTTPTSSTVYLPLRVAGIYDNAMGRIPSSLKIEVIMDYDSLGELLGASVDPADVRIRAFFTQTNLSQYAEKVVVNYPPPRSDPYMDSDMDAVRERVAHFASDIVYKLGFHNVKATLPVMEALYVYSFISMFLGLIIDVSIVVLLFLCVILIYSLLVINVESRTFELGVLRMVGSTREEVVGLLLTQALAYAFPAWILGLPLAELVTYLVFKIIEDVTDVPLPTDLTDTAIGVSTLLCFAIPIIGAVLPIRYALKQNLSDSLDTRRSKTQAVKIDIERSEHKNIPWTVLIVGVFLAAFGIGVVVVFPTSLISLNIELLLGLFFVLIILMLVGLVLLSLNIECLLYKFLALIFFFWDKLAVRKILFKNLVAHRLRNRKTTVMYSVSMSFVIFMFVAYSTMMKSFSYEIEQAYGTDIGVSVSGEDANNTPYSIRIAAQLEAYAAASPVVEGYAWKTLSLSDVTKSTYVAQNTGRYADEVLHVYGISPDFFDVTNKRYLNFAARDKPEAPAGEGISVSEQLYSDQGSKGFMLGAYYRDSLGLKLGSQFSFTEYLKTVNVQDAGATSLFSSMFGSTEYTTGETPLPLRKKAFVFMNTAPGMTFSKFSSLYQDAAVSFPHYIALSRGAVKSMNDLPLGTFYLKMKSGLSKNELNYVKQNLTDICAQQNDGAYFNVWNLKQLLSTMDVANDITNYFFIFTTVIAMVASFFSLSSSMLANVYEQTKEIGVLRALGVPKTYMYRIYGAEAFIIVFGSSLLGIIIGTFIGWTMTIQRVLFTQLPLTFVFPWEITLIVFALSIFFAALSSYGPIVKVMSKNVIQILRMNV